MIRQTLAFLCLTAMTATAAETTNFSGTWQFSPSKSKNVGMMSQMAMTQTIDQSNAALDVTTHTTFQGKDDESKTHYDLTGKASTNESPMGGPAETVSRWEAGKLLTTWTSESATTMGSPPMREIGSVCRFRFALGSSSPMARLRENAITQGVPTKDTTKPNMKKTTARIIQQRV